MQNNPPDHPRVPNPDSDIDAVLEAVGPRLREIRDRRGMTLAEVSGLLGISGSTLSRLESGGRRPTLDLLVKLARIHQVALDDLVGAPPTGDPRIRPNPIRRGGKILVPLTNHSAPVQAVKMILPGRDPGEPITQSTHGGFEWIYVLSGSVDLKIGDTVTTLGTGEAAEFETFRPHGMVSATEEPAEILALFSAEGEAIHVRPGNG